MRRNSSAAVVQASKVQETTAIDAYCHPVDLEEAFCNCGNFSTKMQCLVSLMAPQNADQTNLEPPDLEGLRLDDEEKESQEECSEGEDDDEDDDDYFTVENFIVKGSFHEERYQSALHKCDAARRKKEPIHVRVEFEPDNIEDKNAIKFEVNFDNEWLMIGYCEVKKIPKLRTAMKQKEIKTLSLLFVKRGWIPCKSKLCFYACVSIVKKGQWSKDSSTNHYNSNLD